jgi:hypothetical protein
VNSDREPFESVSIDYSDLDLSITIHPNEIELFEISTGKFVHAYPLDAHAQVAQLITESPELVLFLGTDDNVYEVVVSLVERRAILPTKDEYIFALHYEPELALGAHFGLYGWGLFTVKEDTLHPLFSQETQNLRTGCLVEIGEDLVALLGYRNGQIDAIKVDPTSSISDLEKQQARVWTIQDTHPLTSLQGIKEQLVSTHQNGYVQVRDLSTGTLLHSTQVTYASINCLAQSGDLYYVGTKTGEVIALDLKSWEQRWTMLLSPTSINGCAVLTEGICFVDNGYGVYWLDPHTGEKRKEIRYEIGVASNPLQFKHAVLVGGAAHLLAFSGEKCIEKHYWEDNLIRALCAYPKGLLAGNDNGTISLWIHGGITIKRRGHYEFVLQKFKDKISRLIKTMQNIAEREED